MGDASLRSADAVALAHALCARVASGLGMRIVSIKGPAAEHHRLRRPHQSADADVLVHPDDFATFCGALEARGWHQRVARETPTLIESHSRTYIHERWPCDIDVHDRFPGFFDAPGVVFDMLWGRRESLIVSHQPIAIPSLAASAVIGALHSLRNMTAPRHVAEWEQVIDAVAERFTPSERSAFLDVAVRGRAAWVLRDAIDAVGLGPAPVDVTVEEREIWSNHVRFAAEGGAASWILELTRGPLRYRILTLIRAVWVPRSMIPRNDPSSVVSVGEAFAYQRRRWARGAKAAAHFAIEKRKSRRAA